MSFVFPAVAAGVCDAEMLWVGVSPVGRAELRVSCGLSAVGARVLVWLGLKCFNLHVQAGSLAGLSSHSTSTA